jgi:glutathione S-transferase
VLAKIPEFAKMWQLESDEKLEAKSAKNLKDSLDLVDTVFLRGPGKFLENGEEVSLADIVLVCQLKQLQVSYQFHIP